MRLEGAVENDVARDESALGCVAGFDVAARQHECGARVGMAMARQAQQRRQRLACGRRGVCVKRHSIA